MGQAHLYPWGVFETEREVHSMPCDVVGFPTGGHEASPDCPCEPAIDLETLSPPYKRVMYKHQDVEIPWPQR